MRDRVAYLHLRTRLDTRDDISHITRTDLFARTQVKFEDTDLIRVVFLAGIDKTHLIAGMHCTVHYLEIGDDTSETIEDRVEYQTLQRRTRIAYRRRDALNDSIQDLRHTFACLGGAT